MMLKFEIEMKKDQEEMKGIKLDNIMTESTTSELMKEVECIKKTIKLMIN